MIETTKKVTIYRAEEINGVSTNVLVSETIYDKPQEEINTEARQFLSDTDWKIIRHMDELNAGVETSMTNEEYQYLFNERQEARNLIM